MTDILELIDVSRMLIEGVEEPCYHLDDLIVESEGQRRLRSAVKRQASPVVDALSGAA